MPTANDLLKNVGGTLGANEAAEIARKTGLTVSSVIARAEKAGLNIGGGAQNLVTAEQQQRQQNAINTATAAANPGTQATFTQTSWGQPVVTYVPTSPPAQSSSAAPAAAAPAAAAPAVDPLKGYFDFMTAQSANNLAVEQVRKDAVIEREKLIGENALAVGAQELAGKLDLQKIVNAGYKNIANIERGSDMFNSLMSAFNF